MSVVINTNTAATSAAYNLSNTNVNLQRSLNRLSSGSRINSSFDDAGGLAVSMKMSASIRRTDATLANVNNSVAFLQTQDGVSRRRTRRLIRMSELATLAQDVTKTTTDLSLYNTELDQLKGQLRPDGGGEVQRNQPVQFRSNSRFGFVFDDDRCDIPRRSSDGWDHPS
jgi:flagellin